MFLISFILALRVVLVAKLVISGILSSISLILALYTSFFRTSFFNTSLSLVYLNQQEQVLIYQHLLYLVHFSIYEYLVYLHKLIQFFFAKSDGSTPVAFFKSTFVA